MDHDRNDMVVYLDEHRQASSRTETFSLIALEVDRVLPSSSALHEAVEHATVAVVVIDGSFEAGESWPNLSEAERVRFRSLSGATAKQFARGRHVLRELAGALLRIDAREIDLRVSDYGKPFIPARPGAPSLWLSISHSGECLAFAFSRHSAVGVDIERLRAVDRWKEIAERVLTRDEHTELTHAVSSGADASRALLRQWCRIEAAYKAIGTGLLSVDAYPHRPRPTGVRVRDLPTAGDEKSFCGAVAFDVTHAAPTK